MSTGPARGVGWARPTGVRKAVVEVECEVQFYNDDGCGIPRAQHQSKKKVGQTRKENVPEFAEGALVYMLKGLACMRGKYKLTD